ncbi:hypothetical protein [Levilactobacillus spicheri]|uniref:Uncharacterized protein n=1 Tax=Levilactobacillus spicheri TaxID=216463 RepID=A0ABQ0WS07_9LACO|nr:hypothetical protein [Levilactobacillus spicheri]GEO67907.1 hypothetical protein LSP04_23260 [Levilactobacillus spicheri]
MNQVGEKDCEKQCYFEKSGFVIAFLTAKLGHGNSNDETMEKEAVTHDNRF